MDDGCWEAEGGRLQSWLMRHLSVRGRTVTGGFHGIEVGLVVGRYFKDDEGNIRGLYTEYDVFLPYYQITLRNLEYRVPYQGPNGGLQVTLQPADGVPDMSDPQAGYEALMASSGDLVSVEYVSTKIPVITGCLNHIRATNQHATDWLTGAADGAVYGLTYNTTRARINNEGQVEIDFDDSSDDHTREVVINVDGTQFLKVAQDIATGAVRIELGSGASLEKAVLGESLLAQLNALYAPAGSGGLAYHTHQYMLSGSPTASGGPDATAPNPLTPALIPLTTIDENTVLTEKVKLEG